jgi:hypothetical protein
VAAIVHGDGKGGQAAVEMMLSLAVSRLTSKYQSNFACTARAVFCGQQTIS